MRGSDGSGWQRRLLMVMMLAAVFVVAASCRGDGSPAAGPRLVLDGDTFDLGVIGADKTVERTVAFRNQGEETLTVSIVKVRPAPSAECGCGVEGFEIRPALVQPGGTGQLVFKLRAPEGMQGMQDTMLAELESNDPAHPQVTITLLFRMGVEVGQKG